MWLVFWIYNVVVGFLFNIALGWVLSHGLVFVALPLSLFSLAYAVWVLVSIWRCAANSSSVWCFLARLIVVISIVWSIVRLVHAFV